MTITNDLIDQIEIIPLINTLEIKKINDEEYFSNTYKDYISNSRLSLISSSLDDPTAFFEGFSGSSMYNDSLLIGSAVHQTILQPELFCLSEVTSRPTAKLGFMADVLYPSYLKNELTEETIIEASNKVGYYKGKLTKDKIDLVLKGCTQYWEERSKDWVPPHLTPIYLDLKSHEKVLKCIDSVNRNNNILNLLYPTGTLCTPHYKNEEAILLDLKVKIPGKPEFILKLKAKVDNYSIDFTSNTIVINDLKTIGKILSEFNNNFEKFHYYRELVIYSWLLSLCASKFYNMSQCKIQSNCLVVSTIPSFYSKVYQVTKSDFSKGWDEFKYLIKVVAYYYSEGYKFK